MTHPDEGSLNQRQKMCSEQIKTKQEYESILFRIERLMDAKAGTPELEELKRLTLLVEDYEDIHYPIEPPDPSIS